MDNNALILEIVQDVKRDVRYLSEIVSQSIEKHATDSEKIRALETYRDDHIADHKWVTRSIYGTLIASAAALLVAYLKG